ncbi:PepSY-associated TM helix domain-containing protein [Sphingopyxis sp. PET50]|uniref:PepSY-associated TM helix domain-containing protein n=1 Tax=Sphingopyxis sp. PET50 TaxID=2976533 RepID=UPI00391C2110
MTEATRKAKVSLRSPVLKIHRWLSIGAAIFWLLQAITGVLIVFHWEINDAAISRLERPTDLAAIERRIDALAPPGGAAIVQSVWDSGSNSDRYVVFMQDAEGVRRGVRLAGDGTILRNAAPDDSTLMEFLVGFHHDLLGEWGSWIVAISGILLCSNLSLGLVAAWPKRGTWRRALVPTRKGPVAARLYSWHRAIGLWAVVPALVIAATGTMMKFEDGVGSLVGAAPVALPANPRGRRAGRFRRRRARRLSPRSRAAA